MVTPCFSLLSNDKNITEAISKSLVSLRASEQLGGFSDALTVTLSDANNNLALPATGTELTLSLGFDNKLTKIGLFIVDEVSLQCPPAQMVITARAAPFFRSKQYRAMQTHKTRHFENITLADLAKTVASEYSLKVSVAKRFESVHFEHINQQDESDINLLRRLTDELHARVKVVEGSLALVDLNSSRTNRDTKLPSIDILPENLSRWQATLAGRTQYKSVIASYRDMNANQTVEVQAGESEPTRRLPHLYESKQAAMRAANARLIADKTGRGNFKATMIGSPQLKASMLLNLSGFRESINAQWQCISVEHLLNNQGFTTQFSATIK